MGSSIPIVDHELTRGFSRDQISKLLQGPLGSRMSGQVEMQDSTRSDLHHNEPIENAEARRYGNKEIATMVLV